MFYEFPFSIQDQQTSFKGTLSISKLSKSYHSDHNYYQINFLEGIVSFRDIYNKIIYEENIKGINAVIALKQNLQRESPQSNEANYSITNVDSISKKVSEFMVVNIEMKNKNMKSRIIKCFLSMRIKKIFAGNEDYLLKIK